MDGDSYVGESRRGPRSIVKIVGRPKAGVSALEDRKQVFSNQTSVILRGVLESRRSEGEKRREIWLVK